MSSSQLRVAQVPSHESKTARQIIPQDRAAPVSHSQSKGRNILSKLQDQGETQPVPVPVYSDQTTFKASKKPAKIARQVKQQISNRLGKVPEAEFELARRPVLEGPNFSAALVNLLQSNQNSFSVTFSANQQFVTVDPAIANQVHQNKTTPAEQLASNISNFKHSSINDTTRPIRSIKRKSQQEPPATGRMEFDNQYGTLPHQVLPVQPIKKSSNSTMRSGIDRQLET